MLTETIQLCIFSGMMNAFNTFLNFAATHPVLTILMLIIFCTTLASISESMAKAVRR